MDFVISLLPPILEPPFCTQHRWRVAWWLSHTSDTAVAVEKRRPMAKLAKEGEAAIHEDSRGTNDLDLASSYLISICLMQPDKKI